MKILPPEDGLGNPIGYCPKHKSSWGLACWGAAGGHGQLDRTARVSVKLMSTEHWVSALGADWPFGVAPYGQIGKHLKPLLAAHPFSEVQLHWKHFCAAAQREVAQEPEKARYWTPAKFAQYFDTWAPPSHSPVFTLYQPQSKSVLEEVGKRSRIVQVPLSDPRPAI